MEQEPKANGQLPIISEETASKLKEDLGLDISAATQSVLQGITKEKKDSRREKLDRLVSDTAFDIADVNPKFVEALTTGIVKGHFYGESISVRSDIVRGMALMIRAFDIGSGFKLMQNLSKISDNVSIEKIQETVVKNLGEKKQLDPFEMALKTPRIPDVQINLNELVHKASGEVLFGSYFRQGASAMYEVLSKFKSELFPQNQNPPGDIDPPVPPVAPSPIG